MTTLPLKTPFARLLGTLCCLALFALPALALGGGKQKTPRNDPSNDPYTGGDPEVWAKAGIVSMGGFEFGDSDTKGVDAALPTSDIRWIETEHFEIGFALGSYKVSQKEKARLRAELTELAKVLPNVKPKTKKLDPWLRLHLYAVRAEKLYDRFLQLVQIDDESVFPDGTKSWDTTGTYWGEGPYLGQKGKFEILILPSEAAHVTYLRDNFGQSNKKSQRWNHVPRQSISVTIHERQASLKVDIAMHAHLAFNLGHNLLDGFKFYAYDSPIWLREGIGHFMEREISPKYNTFDGGEGSVPEMTKKSKWRAEALKLVRSGKAPRMAEMVRFKNYGELELDHHFTTWSMVDFLATAHPKKFADLIKGLKGITNAEGYSDGSDLPARQRELFKSLWGWSLAQFDEAWAAWVLETY